MYNIHSLSEYELAHHAAQRFKRLLITQNIPSDIAEKIEDEILPALEYIENWEPSDADIVSSNSCGTPWHDGCL